MASTLPFDFNLDVSWRQQTTLELTLNKHCTITVVPRLRGGMPISPTLDMAASYTEPSVGEDDSAEAQHLDNIGQVHVTRLTAAREPTDVKWNATMTPETLTRELKGLAGHADTLTAPRTPNSLTVCLVNRARWENDTISHRRGMDKTMPPAILPSYRGQWMF